jgi:pyruvate dehydrogenase E2 component (dihydrolipoamide acetyltransferase)
MTEVKLPSLGADMDEGSLVAWLIAPGDTVERGQVIAEVETDKGIIEVECWEDGYVDALLLDPGPEKVVVGTPIARLRPLDESVHPNADEVDGERTEDPRKLSSDVVDHSGGAVESPPTRGVPPPIRHLAHELRVDVDHVTPTGDGGAITREDVRAAADLVRSAQRRPRATPRARKVAIERNIDLSDVHASRSDGLVVTSDLPAVPPTGVEEDPGAAMRRAIARSMERSKREIPHYYLGTQIDLAAAMDWLEDTNEHRSLTSRILPIALLLRAVSLALARAPDLNGHWVDGRFEHSAEIHLGVAVSLRTGGLVAPAILNADRLSLDEMMAALTDLVARARSGRLRSSEMSHATVTVTSLGDRGVDTVFPIIVPPQVAMVGFGRIAERPVAVGGDVVAHMSVGASLTADHRVTDGHSGGLFLLAIDKLLQEPDSL